MSASGRTRPASVVIAVRNGAATIGEQLAALCDQAAECDEIVVADNGSTDDTRAVVDSFGDRIATLRVIDAFAQVGIVEVRNHAAAHTDGDMIWCDADDVVAPGWIRAMTAGLDRHHVVGGRIEEHSLNGPLARARTMQADGLARPWDFMSCAIGANVGMRREVINTLGGWNPRYGSSGEDIDFCWRAHLAGYQIGFAPDAVVHYRHRNTGQPLRAQQAAYGRAAAMLHRDYRRHGLRRGSVVHGARVWGRIGVLTPMALVRPGQRLRWHAAFGYGCGTVTGMLRERAWPY